jgi:hypothetical protein
MNVETVRFIHRSGNQNLFPSPAQSSIQICHQISSFLRKTFSFALLEEIILHLRLELDPIAYVGELQDIDTQNNILGLYAVFLKMFYR